MSQIMEILNINENNMVIKWSVCGETGEFIRRIGSGRPINKSFFGQRQGILS